MVKSSLSYLLLLLLLLFCGGAGFVGVVSFDSVLFPAEAVVSTEGMLDRQRQRVDIPAHTRIANNGSLPQKRPEEDL